MCPEPHTVSRKPALTLTRHQGMCAERGDGGQQHWRTPGSTSARCSKLRARETGGLCERLRCDAGVHPGATAIGHRPARAAASSDSKPRLRRVRTIHLPLLATKHRPSARVLPSRESCCWFALLRYGPRSRRGLLPASSPPLHGLLQAARCTRRVAHVGKQVQAGAARGGGGRGWRAGAALRACSPQRCAHALLQGGGR